MSSIDLQAHPASQCYNSIKDDHIKFLASHTTPPFSFIKHVTLADLELNLPEVEKGLRSAEHQFTFMLSDSNSGPFKDLCQVHLSSMEVWLEGVHPTRPQVSVALQVQTNGIYRNVDAMGNWLTFSTTPLNGAFFVYPLGDSDKDQAEMPLEFGDPFIQPTPFTHWTITLSNPDEVDLSNLCSVRFRWKGSGYSSARRSARSEIE